MNTKLFTILDEDTKTYVMAVKLDSEATKTEEEILKNSGWGNNEFRKDRNYVILVPINGGVCSASNIAEDWDSTTFIFAHMYIKAHFKELSSGDTISIQNIRKKFVKVID